MNMLNFRNIIRLLLIVTFRNSYHHFLGAIKQSTANAQVNKSTDRKFIMHSPSSSWNGVLTANHERLSDGCCADPLRGVKSDADYVASALKTSTDPSCWLGNLRGSVITMPSMVTGT